MFISLFSFFSPFFSSFFLSFLRLHSESLILQRIRRWVAWHPVSLSQYKQFIILTNCISTKCHRGRLPTQSLSFFSLYPLLQPTLVGNPAQRMLIVLCEGIRSTDRDKGMTTITQPILTNILKVQTFNYASHPTTFNMFSQDKVWTRKTSVRIQF